MGIMGMRRMRIIRGCADFASTISSRELEDDAMVNFRMEGGTVGRLWTSSVAIGRQHGFDIQVFGETGGRTYADHGEGRGRIVR